MSQNRVYVGDIQTLALIKGNEKYVFLYDDATRGEVLRTLGRFASDPGLSFTWYDAAELSKTVRKRAKRDKPSSECDGEVR